MPIVSIQNNPLFKHEPTEMFHSTIDVDKQDEILAKGIPALSPPLGVVSLCDGQIESNVNMNEYKPNGWCRDHKTYNERWLHSDIQNVAYYFTFPVFDSLVSVGELE